MRRLTVEREAAQLSRTQLGFGAKVHPAEVGRVESGRATPPRDSIVLKRLAAALGWTGDPAALLDEVG